MRLIDADAIINKLNKKMINPETVFINTVLKGLIERVDCGEVADAIEKLQLEADGMRSNWYKSIVTITELRCEIERVKRERDAVIKYMNKTVVGGKENVQSFINCMVADYDSRVAEEEKE